MTAHHPPPPLASLKNLSGIIYCYYSILTPSETFQLQGWYQRERSQALIHRRSDPNNNITGKIAIMIISLPPQVTWIASHCLYSGTEETDSAHPKNDHPPVRTSLAAVSPPSLSIDRKGGLRHRRGDENINLGVVDRLHAIAPWTKCYYEWNRFPVVFAASSEIA